MSEINEQKIYTVKHGLNKFIKGPNKQLILNRIEQDVIEMSNLAFEASRLIYFNIPS